MRLTAQEVDTIKKAIVRVIPDAKVMLFGSRVDDEKRGGDIDIFVRTEHKINLSQKIDILTEIEQNGVMRKVDLLIQTPYTKEVPIFQTALETGEVL